MTDHTRRPPLHEIVKAEAYRSPNRILHTKYAESYVSHLIEKVQYSSPLTSENKENVVSSPMQWMSPVTPPSSGAANKTPMKNPFDANLTEHLHLETFSPSVFSEVLSPSQDQDSNWRIEHVALLNPMDFSPTFPSHFSDPIIEAEAQEKILQFFSQKQIAPSPWSNSRSRILTRTKVKNPVEISPVMTAVKNAWTQTALSFPPKLPVEVEEILNKYMSRTQDPAGESPVVSSEADDSSLLNASSLRRKLFAQMGNTPCKEETASDIKSRSQSASPILTTGPHSSRFSFSPSSRIASPPVLSPIRSHEEVSIAMDETTRHSWTETELQQPFYPDRTVSMETCEAGYFSYSTSTMQSKITETKFDSSHLNEDQLGRPVECSTPTKS